jgi:hypothetical protein
LVRQLEPKSVMTTCRAHVDRGMTISVLLYLYLLIKTGQNDHYYRQKVEAMIFAPPSLVFGRPPYFGNIKNILSTMARLKDPLVIQNLTQRKTFFSNFVCTVPTCTQNSLGI